MVATMDPMLQKIIDQVSFTVFYYKGKFKKKKKKQDPRKMFPTVI